MCLPNEGGLQAPEGPTDGIPRELFYVQPFDPSELSPLSVRILSVQFTSI